MTPHDCATQGHRWEIDVACACGQCSLVSLDESLDSLLRRALTDAVLNEAWLSAVAQSTFAEDSKSSCAAMRDVLITAILTAARETGR